MTSHSLAFSPCPNDTFVFHALVHGLVPGAPRFDVKYADLDVTNNDAERGAYDLVKVSYAALPWLLEKYQLLPCGGALGRGCGPLVLTRDETTDPATLRGATVAVPSDRSTAYLLFRLWAADVAPGQVEVVPFDTIMPGVAAGTWDAGLVIHEARFTYPQHGLTKLADLGEWWEGTTGLPIPLGAILARRDGVDAAAATDWIRASVRYAWDHPEASRDFVLAHAQEMDPSVAQQHIDLSVNRFTAELGDEGDAAIDGLLSRAVAAGIVPPLPGPLR